MNSKQMPDGRGEKIDKLKEKKQCGHRDGELLPGIQQKQPDAGLMQHPSIYDVQSSPSGMPHEKVNDHTTRKAPSIQFKVPVQAGYPRDHRNRAQKVAAIAGLFLFIATSTKVAGLPVGTMNDIECNFVNETNMTHQSYLYKNGFGQIKFPDAEFIIDQATCCSGRSLLLQIEEQQETPSYSPVTFGPHLKYLNVTKDVDNLFVKLVGVQRRTYQITRDLDDLDSPDSGRGKTGLIVGLVATFVVVAAVIVRVITKVISINTLLLLFTDRF